MRLLTMYTAVCVATLGALAGATGAIAETHMDRAMMKLEPEERAHQACNMRGIEAVRKGAKLKGVDRLKSGSLSPAHFKDNKVTANGAAVRAGHHWYELKYTCTVTDDQMRATSFDFKLGAEIPEDKWEDYGLWK
ncbi:hypothetical protein DLM45_16120 [Hyphomicrobium methylovorum]|uniref:DUF930 domain-containing protein n=1 Tax=Hyphomicrobium methylovorum TaxID=84 RepID=UPI0015E79901|nr:DUF930 domain-containing protein [Hyphomicrobium methylovorum]MBA2127738.1 hypothetical protein [Hyphomicrobium methylovorum]